MGCGSSRSTAIVAPMPTVPATAAVESRVANSLTESNDNTPERVTVSYTRVREEGSGPKTSSIIKVKEMPGSCDSLPTESQYGSSESVTESTKSIPPCLSGEYRNGSAKSNDSGLGRDHTEIIITENSSETMKDIAKIPEDVPEPNLTVDGKQMKTLGPMGHRKRNIQLPPVHPNSQQKIQRENTVKNNLDNLDAILQKRVQFADELINELPSTASIVKRPVSRGGVAFDITSFSEESNRRSSNKRPECVRKYAQHRRAAEVVTHAELDEKQKAADQRRRVSSELTSYYAKSLGANVVGT